MNVAEQSGRLMQSAGLFMCGISMLLFDSELISALSAKGNIGIVGAVSFAGCLLLLFGSIARFHLDSRVDHGPRRFLGVPARTRTAKAFVVLVYLWPMWMVATFLFNGADAWTVIGIFNLFTQIGISGIILMSMKCRLDGRHVYGGTMSAVALVALAILVWFVRKDSLNENWMAILIATSLILYAQGALSDRPRGFLVAIASAMSFYVCFVMLGSRGSILIMIVYFSLRFLARFYKPAVGIVVLPVLLVLSSFSGSLGAQFFGSTDFGFYDRFSRDTFGKTLAVSRFERIVEIENNLLDNPSVYFVGVGASGYSLREYADLKASHNTFQDVIFFSGIVGWSIKLALLMLVIPLIYESRRDRGSYLAVYGALLVPMNFYGILGFTHLAGTIPGYFCIALMISRSQNGGTPRSPFPTSRRKPRRLGAERESSENFRERSRA